MTIRELIDRLSQAGKRIGFDADVTYVVEEQFSNVTGVDALTSSNCPPELKWCFSGPVAVLELEKD